MKEYYDYDEILLTLEEPKEDFYETRSRYINLTTDYSLVYIF